MQSLLIDKCKYSVFIIILLAVISAGSAVSAQSIAYHSPTWSPDGSRIAFVTNLDGAFNPYWIKPDGTDLVRIFQFPSSGSELKWSPDGRFLAYSASGLYIYELSTGLSTLVPTGAEIERPSLTSWNADGEFIVFEGRIDGNRDLFQIRPDGSGLTRLTKHSANDLSATYHPSGSLFAFQSNRSGKYHIYIKDIETGEVSVLTDGEDQYAGAKWAPNGERILYSSIGELNCLMVRNIAANEERCIVTNRGNRDHAAAWSPNSEEIVFMIEDGENLALTIVSANGTNQRQLTHDQQ